MRLNEILRGIDFACRNHISNIEIEGIRANSKSIKVGDLFVALKGPDHDGHDFIAEAAQRGAAAVITEKPLHRNDVVLIRVEDSRRALPIAAANFYGHPSAALKIIGATGTNGKTTITYILESILKRAGLGVGVIGTIEHRIGQRVVESGNTTPGCLELQAMLKAMADSHLKYAIIEVSSHGLDQDRMGGLTLDAAAFTNITPEHLDYHKTMTGYLKAKSKIFKFLKPGGVAVLNADDIRVSALASKIKNRIITYGIKKKASYMAGDITTGISGSAFTVAAEKGDIRIKTHLMGLHNVSNILAAIAITQTQGIGLEDAKKGIEGLRVIPGRLEAVSGKAPFDVLVDYAHTDDALRNVLGLLRSIAKRRIITVFGCGGNRDSSKRPRMGRAACEFSDKVVITSDNPREERPDSIISDILKGIKGRFSNFSIEEDRRKAIEAAIGMAKKDDIILIAGKGHERYQIIGDEIIPFDDREIVRDILQ